MVPARPRVIKPRTPPPYSLDLVAAFDLEVDETEADEYDTHESYVEPPRRRSISDPLTPEMVEEARRNLEAVKARAAARKAERRAAASRKPAPKTGFAELSPEMQAHVRRMMAEARAADRGGVVEDVEDEGRIVPLAKPEAKAAKPANTRAIVSHPWQRAEINERLAKLKPQARHSRGDLFVMFAQLCYWCGHQKDGKIRARGRNLYVDEHGVEWVRLMPSRLAKQTDLEDRHVIIRSVGRLVQLGLVAVLALSPQRRYFRVTVTGASS